MEIMKINALGVVFRVEDSKLSLVHKVFAAFRTQVIWILTPLCKEISKMVMMIPIHLRISSVVKEKRVIILKLLPIFLLVLRMLVAMIWLNKSSINVLIFCPITKNTLNTMYVFPKALFLKGHPVTVKHF